MLNNKIKKRYLRIIEKLYRGLISEKLSIIEERWKRDTNKIPINNSFYVERLIFQENKIEYESIIRNSGMRQHLYLNIPGIKLLKNFDKELRLKIYNYIKELLNKIIENEGMESLKALEIIIGYEGSGVLILKNGEIRKESL